jgi:hypothetical protein
MYRHGPTVCFGCGETLSPEQAEWSERGQVCWRCGASAKPAPPPDMRKQAIYSALGVFCLVHGGSVLLGGHAWWAICDLALASWLTFGRRPSRTASSRAR